MVVILSDKNDLSTNDVIDWLIAWNVPYRRYNGPGDLTMDFWRKNYLSIRLGANTNEISLNSQSGHKYKASDISALWHRRPYNLPNDFFLPLSDQLQDTELEGSQEYLGKIQLENVQHVKEYIVKNHGAKTLGDYFNTSLNKIEVLKIALECGLEIPETLITSSKEDLKKFLEGQGGAIICKSLARAPTINDAHPDYWISNKTTLITNLDECPKKFGMAIFQSFVKKKYELRVFYLDGEFYTACIFSQDKSSTSVDYRNYDWDQPTRMVPYELDQELKDRLTSLMQRLELNTGSIDIMVDDDNRKLFLEVNAVGQYGFVSEPCGFDLSHKIAAYLSESSQ